MGKDTLWKRSWERALFCFLKREEQDSAPSVSGLTHMGCVAYFAIEKPILNEEVASKGLRALALDPSELGPQLHHSPPVQT